jgi:hypothetical protein
MPILQAAAFSVLLLGANCMTLSAERASTVETRATWKFLGCYTDNVSGRALPNAVSVPGGSAAMQNEACQTACMAAGFSIAGTEYSGECCEYITSPLLRGHIANKFRVRQFRDKWGRACP